jgi:hypothetical protein
MPGANHIRKDGTRLGIGGPYRNRIGLTRAEYLVMIQALNELSDEGHVELQRTLYDGEVVKMNIIDLIQKLLAVGHKCGWVSIPSNCPLK